MKFAIFRASLSSHGPERPCEEATLKCRDKDFYEWEVEINSLEALVAFSEKHGDLTFAPGRIWIYDDYME